MYQEDLFMDLSFYYALKGSRNIVITKAHKPALNGFLGRYNDGAVATQSAKEPSLLLFRSHPPATRPSKSILK